MTKTTLAAFAERLSSADWSAFDWNAKNFSKFTPNRVKIELLAGLTVALALVPEAVAFSFVAGVHPLVGLYAAFIVGLITAIIGGRPGMISGATGALAVVMVALVAQHGVEYLFATVVLMGILQLLAGAFRLGKFIRLVPHPVMLGFVNGLAIVIFLAQLSQFQVPGSAEVSADAHAGKSAVGIGRMRRGGVAFSGPDHCRLVAAVVCVARGLYHRARVAACACTAHLVLTRGIRRGCRA